MFYGFRRNGSNPHAGCCENCTQARLELESLRDLADQWEKDSYNPARDRASSVVLAACASQLHQRLGMPWVLKFRKGGVQ